MNSTSDNRPDDDAVYEPDLEATYTLEAASELCEMSTQTVVYYQQQGLLRGTSQSEPLGNEALRTLRRIEHLKRAYEMNLAGVRMMLALMDEVESLRNDLRARR